MKQLLLVLFLATIVMGIPKPQGGSKEAGAGDAQENQGAGGAQENQGAGGAQENQGSKEAGAGGAQENQGSKEADLNNTQTNPDLNNTQTNPDLNNTQTNPGSKEAGAGGAQENQTSVEDKNTAKLKIDSNEVPPDNVINDHYGKPIKQWATLNFTMSDGQLIRILTESWRTRYTFPATIPNCFCITRGPIPNFKKYGNLHFPHIKVTPPRHVTEPTTGGTTICPPCACPDCNGQPVMPI